MNKFLATQYERIAVGVAAMALAVSLGISWSLRADVRRIKLVPVTLHLAKADDRPALLSVAVKPEEPWATPPAQSAGKEWIYEVFTPPVVFYDRQAARFSVTPAGALRGDDREFAFQLVGVRRELFRVQLSGYAGAPGSYTAIFTRPHNPAVLLVRAGERLKEVGLVLQHFAIEKRTTVEHDHRPGFEIVAVAELQDERSGTITVLDSVARKFDEALVATVHLSDSPGATREVRERDLFSNGGCAYRVSHIQCDPAEIIITREPPGLPPATKPLRLVEAKPPQPASISESPTKSSFRPATGIVDNDK